MPTLNEVVSELPYRVRIRFTSLAAFVRTVVRESEKQTPKAERISREQLEEIQLIVFTRSLEFLLREGSAAAEGATAAFDEIGAGPFSVGTTVFATGNENTTRGDDLADNVDEILEGCGGEEYVELGGSLTHMIETLWQKAMYG